MNKIHRTNKTVQIKKSHLCLHNLGNNSSWRNNQLNCNAFDSQQNIFDVTMLVSKTCESFLAYILHPLLEEEFLKNTILLSRDLLPSEEALLQSASFLDYHQQQQQQHSPVQYPQQITNVSTSVAV